MLWNDIKRMVWLTPITTTIWWSMILAAILLVYFFNLSWWMVPVFAFSFLFIHEIVAFSLGLAGVFPSKERIARSYEWFDFFMDGCHSGSKFEKMGDLTEGYFNGDYTKPIAKAVTDKYDEVIRLLGLKPGHRVLDVGCGLGDFLTYLKTKGIEGVGFNVSPHQILVGTGKGLDVRNRDFRDGLTPDLVGKFDAVTFMGCLENFVNFYYYSKKNRDPILKIYHQTFETARQALSPTSPVKKIFTTTLHRRADYQCTPYDYFQGFLLHGHYCGFYPNEGDFEVACKPYFEVVHKYDASADYQQSTLISPDHFGHFKINWDLRKIFLGTAIFLVNPFAFSTWAYHFFDTWMWQLGGLKPVEESKRPTKTLWYVYQAN